MRTSDMARSALFAAVVAALGLFPPILLPVVPVPVTVQTLGVMLAGSVIGARRAAVALLLFLVLVAAGVPLLAGGRGGLVVFLSPSAGFLLSWPVAAFVVGLLVERRRGRLGVPYAFAANCVGGIGIVHLCGVTWLVYGTRVPLPEAVAASSLFLVGDVLKALVASSVAVAVRRAYPIGETAT